MSAMSGTNMQQPQLHMIWPSGRTITPTDLQVKAPYFIRRYRPGDEQSFLALMAISDFDCWDDRKLAFNIARTIPDGWFFAVDTGEQSVAGTGLCLHNYCGNAPFTGDVGWIFCAPRHRGHGLGYALTANVVSQFVQAGYSRIQLHTESHRLAAIKIYLKLGFIPLLGSPVAHSQWTEACRQVNWPFSPETWASTAGLSRKA